MSSRLNDFFGVVSKMGQVGSSLLVFAVGVVFLFTTSPDEPLAGIMITVLFLMCGGLGLLHAIKYEIYDAIHRDLDKQKDIVEEREKNE